jgi:DNA-binding response OmpR family regulator
VADDEIDTARTLGRILETSGFKVDILTDPMQHWEVSRPHVTTLPQLMLECPI